ncbi:tetrathionate reductase family octaheme c-type cytochrome [Azospirillum sp. A39]|uniref:tetrathionate reductase family octaheme c-type cytochrome n=1 Tax=Azospirillum sp. A39 TaxID=3462279 RepID=UPI004045A7EA
MPIPRCGVASGLGAVLLVVFAVATTACAAEAPAAAASRSSTADHSRFDALQGPFANGPEVTKACLACHNEAAHQVMKSVHWTWDYLNEKTGERLGKTRTMNSFCGSPLSNEPRCTSCHAGYGWTDQGFDFTRQDNVDCLVCHDTTGTYKKIAHGAGHPVYEPTEIPAGSGKIMMPPDLAKVARSVGAPARTTCGACHFNGGGGDGVKHGDLDSSLASPPRHVDVHMAPDGADMTCADCHTFNAHIPSGSRYATTAKDTHGKDLPHDDHNRATCESCHGDRPHAATGRTKLDDHTDRVACQTCHIPEFARGGVATKMLWDWSTAGHKDAEGRPLFIKDDHGHLVYSAEKGDFAYGENVRPHYAWFNGVIDQTTLGETIDDSTVLVLNRFAGGPDDPAARIWPFKEMTGKQPYDTVNKTLVVNHVWGPAGDDTAFWNGFDYDASIKAGMAYAGLPYSGRYGFVETRMYWPITHMVAPKEDALACRDCHARDGRLAGLEGFYMPGRDRDRRLDLAGFALVGLAGAGIAGHALLRILSHLIRRRP